MKEKTYTFSTISDLLFFGFLFSFFNLNMGYLSDFTGALSVLFLWYGFYILKNENTFLQKAWKAALCNVVIFTIIELIRAVSTIGNLWIFVLIRYGCMLYLIYAYGRGMQALHRQFHGTDIVQCKRVYSEYVVVCICALLSPVEPTVFALIIIVLFIVMLVQIHRIHQTIKLQVKNHRFTCRFVPVLPALAGYFIIMIGIIVACRYTTYQHLTSNYDPWLITLKDERMALVEKGLSKQVSEDISDDIVTALSKVEKIHVYDQKQNNNGYFPEYEEYGGMDKEGHMHYLIWIDFDDVDFDGDCSIVSEVNMSRNQGLLWKKEAAYLYDQEDVTYGKKDTSQYFDYNFAHGTHHRGYIYLKNEDTEDNLVEIITNVLYQDSWFQYPYAGQSLSETYEPANDIMMDLTQDRNYHKDMHWIGLDRNEWKETKE